MRKISLFASLAIASSMMANELDTITITTATKTQKSIDGVAASVEVITAEDIAKIGATTIKDVINKTPSLNLQYGTFPSASAKSKSSISIRGMGSKGTLFLIDGRRIGGEVNNPYDLDRINAASVERIEIVKGPMSTLYGADATGGVVNIITKKPVDGVDIDFGVKYGQNSYGEDKTKNVNLAIRGKKDALGYSLYATKTETTPYNQKEDADIYVRTPANTIVKPSVHPHPVISGNLKDYYAGEDVSFREDSDVFTTGGRIEYTINPSIKVGANVDYLKEKRDGSYIGYFHPSAIGAPAYNVPVDSKDDNSRIDVSTDLEAFVTSDVKLDLKAYKSYYKKKNKTTAKYYSDLGYVSKEASAQNGLDANVDVRAIEAVVTTPIGEDHMLVFGGEFRSEDREATVFTNSNDLTKKSVKYKSLYIQDEYEAADDLTFTLGARYDNISTSKNKTTFKLAGVKNFSKEFNLRANASQGFRAADLRELYIFKNTPTGLMRGSAVDDSAVGKSSFDLKPESTNSFEIGANGASGAFNYDLALYYNDIKDMITEKQQGGYITFVNLNKAKTYGFELSMGYNISDDLALDLYYNELRSKDRDSGKEIEFNPKRTVSFGVDWQVLSHLDTSIFAKYIGKQYFVDVINRGSNNQRLVDSHTRSYTTFDWNINYKITKDIKLFGGINNIFNSGIDDVLGSTSGRYYFGGVNFHF